MAQLSDEQCFFKTRLHEAAEAYRVGKLDISQPICRELLAHPNVTFLPRAGAHMILAETGDMSYHLIEALKIYEYLHSTEPENTYITMMFDMCKAAIVAMEEEEDEMDDSGIKASSEEGSAPHSDIIQSIEVDEEPKHPETKESTEETEAVHDKDHKARAVGVSPQRVSDPTSVD